MSAEEQFWQLVKEYGALGAQKAMPPFCAYAVTTGDPATQETVGTITTNQVRVWLNGDPQTEANKVNVTLFHGEVAPGANELWLVLLPNFRPPGLLLRRIA